MTSRKKTGKSENHSLNRNSPVSNRKDLADFLGVSLKRITFVLYSVNRQSYYTKFDINKASGKPRTVYAVNEVLKRLQRAALDRFQSESMSIYAPSGYSHGFTNDKSIITNAALHRRKKLIIKVDLEDFFPSINFGRVQGMFMAPPFNFGREAATTMAQLSCLDSGGRELPQGGVLSPYIANMLCRRLDKRLARLAQENRCRFTRYADDMTFSTNDIQKLDTRAFLGDIYEIIESEHFNINVDKTRVLTRKDRQIVTGIVVNDGLNVNRKYIRNLRATINNCEKFGVKSQIVKRNGFKDNRNSRIQQGDDTKPSEVYFLRHLLGKINFFGNVVLAVDQDKHHADDKNRYQRIETYEELLWRFYQLKEVKRSRNKEIQKTVAETAKRLIRKRSNLQDRLNQSDQAYKVRKSTLDKYRNEEATKQSRSNLKSLKSIEDVQHFIEIKKKSDPRFFTINLTSDVDELKDRVDKILKYPAIDKKKTEILLRSFKIDGGLKNLVHSDEKNNLTIEECYRILKDNYEKIFYELPKKLKDEIENWKEGLSDIANQHDKNYCVDVMGDPLLKDRTRQLKCNTRFGGGGNATRIEQKLNEIIREVNSQIIPVQIVEEGFITSLYTHTESILVSIKKIVKSMVDHSPDYGATTIKIESILKKEEDLVEIIIYDDSTKPAFDTLDSRGFIHGKLIDVITLTNGLCDYIIEASLTDGRRQGLNMHNESKSAPIRSKGFVHRLRFSKIT